MLQVGQKVKNIRTGDIATLKGYKDVWVSRHYVKRALVTNKDGFELVWATSSLQEVEENKAPRALVTLLAIWNEARAGEEKITPLLDKLVTQNTSRIHRIIMLSDTSKYLGSLTGFQQMNGVFLLDLFLLVEVMTSAGNFESVNSLTSFGECGKFTSEILRLYMGYK